MRGEWADGFPTQLSSLCCIRFFSNLGYSVYIRGGGKL